MRSPSLALFLGSGSDFDIMPVEVPSGVRHTPLSRDDLMSGARQRAEALVQHRS